MGCSRGVDRSRVFETEREIAVVGEAGDGENAVTCARRLHPDVVLMDIRMPVLDGIEATRRIVRAQPTTRVLILTTFGLDTYVYDALRAGPAGSCSKTRRAKQFPRWSEPAVGTRRGCSRG